MRERGILLFLSTAAMASLVLALGLYQALKEERRKSRTLESTVQSAEKALAAAKKDGESGRGDPAADPRGKAPGLELCQRIEALEKASAGRDQAVKDALAQMGTKSAEAQAKVADLAVSAVELKGKVGALATKLDEALKLKDQGAQQASFTQVGTQLAALEARVKDLEGKLKDRDVAVAAPSPDRDRLAEEAKKREAEAAAAHKEVDPPGKAQPPARDPPAKPADKSPPAIPVVTSIEAVEAGVVVLGAGSKSGLEAGHVLTVTRDSKPIARVRVVRVREEMSGAEILSAEPGESVQVGDRASTRVEEIKAESPRTADPKADRPLGSRPPPPPPPSASGK